MDRFATAFRVLPRLDAGLLMPGIMALGVYPLLLALTNDPSASFVTAFFMGLWVMLARHAEWAARYWCKRFSVRVASLLAVAAAMGPASVLMMAGQPEWCLRLFSGFAVVVCMILINDLRDGDHAYVRFRLPGSNTPGAEAQLAQALLTWNLCFILLNEALIAALDVSGWMIWYAVLPLVVHAVEAAIVLYVMGRRLVA